MHCSAHSEARGRRATRVPSLEPPEPAATLPRAARAARAASHALAWPFLVLVLIYQRALSPLLPPACRFHPTCSAYGVTALRRHGLFGFWLLARRLLRCHPWNDGGEDPVP